MEPELAREMEDLIPHLRRYARSLIRNDADGADDLVQEALERAISRIDKFERGTNLKAWLFTIQRNCFLNRMRRQVRVDNKSVDVYENEHLIHVQAPQESTVALRRVAEAFNELSAEHQEALQMVAIEGMTYEDAAEVLGVATGTVKSRVGRARSRLRELSEQVRDRQRPRAVVTNAVA